MRKVMMLIPIMTFFMYATILLNAPILREIIVLIYLSFVPGFVFLRLLRLKEISSLDTILFSVGLSIAFSMFVGLIINELYYFLSVSQPLAVVPLTLAISAPTLIVFFIAYRHDLLETLNWDLRLESDLKDVLVVSSLLVLLPLLSIVGVLYVNISIMLLSYGIIAILCIMAVASRKLVPPSLFPFLIFSISIALLSQVLLTSKYILGWDSHLEYYVFKLTLTNGHWGPLNANYNPQLTLTYNSMLSITLLPAIYAVLMNALDETVFRILYPFILSLVPLILYRIYEEQTGKSIGLLSTFFFLFTSVAFYGVTPLFLNRQIVGELFFLLSVFLLLDKAIPATKRRLLLIFFGAALVVSHYSIAYIYLIFIALVFVILRKNLKSDDTLNAEVVLFFFALTFSWYTIGSSSPLTLLEGVIKTTFLELTTGQSSTVTLAGSATTTMLNLPKVFTLASWINLALSGIANFFLIIGLLVMILVPKRTRISVQYRLMSIVAGIILVTSLVAPSIASILVFTRFYALTLLFLSPCFVLGGKAFLVAIRTALMKIKQFLKGQHEPRNKHTNAVILLLIALILSAYFLSQSGFINRVTGGAIHSFSLDFDRMKTSSDPRVKISFYDTYIPEQDVFSAVWLMEHKNELSTVYADYESGTHVLISYGLMPKQLILHLTNRTILEHGSFIYLDTLNVMDGVITRGTGAHFNSSEISSGLSENNLVYSNGYSQIWQASLPS